MIRITLCLLNQRRFNPMGFGYYIYIMKKKGRFKSTPKQCWGNLANYSLPTNPPTVLGQLEPVATESIPIMNASLSRLHGYASLDKRGKKAWQ